MNQANIIRISLIVSIIFLCLGVIIQYKAEKGIIRNSDGSSKEVIVLESTENARAICIAISFIAFVIWLPALFMPTQKVLGMVTRVLMLIFLYKYAITVVVALGNGWRLALTESMAENGAEVIRESVRQMHKLCLMFKTGEFSLDFNWSFLFLAVSGIVISFCLMANSLKAWSRISKEKKLREETERFREKQQKIRLVNAA